MQYCDVDQSKEYFHQCESEENNLNFLILNLSVKHPFFAVIIFQHV